MVNQALTERVLGEFTQVIPRLYRRVQAIQLKMARELSLSRVQMEILSALAQKGVLSATEISALLVIAKPNVATAVDELVSRSLVGRESQVQDRRIILLRLTEQGIAVRKTIQESFRNSVSASLANLGEQELEILDLGLQSLGKVVDHLKP